VNKILDIKQNPPKKWKGFNLWRISDSNRPPLACQIMGDTWNDAEMKEKRTLYNITDFSPISQDKFALILLKYKRASKATVAGVIKNYGAKYTNAYGDIIQAVIDDNLDKALLISSTEWASLPDSPYGQQDAKYTNENVKAIYRNFLKEELAGTTDLKLKRVF